jgi:anti-sigma B factor antagonist
MKFSSRQVDDVSVFDFKGDLVGGPDASKIRDAITEKLEAGERKFLLNMDKVGFVNSTGIGIVVTVYTSINNAGGTMKICNANEKVSRVMVITKLLQVFDSYYKEAEALKAFQSG